MDALPIPRCCSRHADWSILAEHLMLAFTDVSGHEVLTELCFARSGLDLFGLTNDDGGLLVAELIVRHRLMLSTGRSADVARLDPEHHVRPLRLPKQEPRDPPWPNLHDRGMRKPKATASVAE